MRNGRRGGGVQRHLSRRNGVINQFGIPLIGRLPTHPGLRRRRSMLNALCPTQHVDALGRGQSGNLGEQMQILGAHGYFTRRTTALDTNPRPSSR